MEILFWIWVLTWMTKTAAQDVLYAVSGRPNPRYQLKLARAQSAGKPAGSAPRYGTRDWLADLYSDALVAHTARRRAKSKKTPVDDMVALVQEPAPQPVAPRPAPRPSPQQDPQPAERPAPQPSPQPAPKAPEEPKHYEPPIPDGIITTARQVINEVDPHGRGGLAAWDKACEQVEKEHPNADPETIERAVNKAIQDRYADPKWQRHRDLRLPPPPESTPTFPRSNVIPFPTTRKIKEAVMTNEATGLPTAIAYAEAAAEAHQTFATSGSEGYVGALQNMGMSGESVATAQEAQEASQIAAEKWAAHKAHLERQLAGREFYQNNPDAANKTALLSE